MRNTRLEETGRRLTKYECHVAFYDFSRIQGWFLGGLVKMTGFSRITHVAPIITLKSGREVVFTVCESKTTKDGTIIPNCKIHDPKDLEKLGAVLVERISIGQRPLDMASTHELCASYTDAKVWDIVFHAFIGRWIGLTRPRACSSLVCRLFGLPETWHPSTLYRKLKK